MILSCKRGGFEDGIGSGWVGLLIFWGLQKWQNNIRTAREKQILKL